MGETTQQRGRGTRSMVISPLGPVPATQGLRAHTSSQKSDEQDVADHPMKRQKFSDLVGNGVYIPAGVVYMWIAAGHFFATGIGVYLAFMVAGYAVGVFGDVREWPKLALLALGCGPVLVATGVVVSFMRPSYYILVPLCVYTVVTFLGIWALSSKYGDSYLRH
jgi:hypothetical protein